MYSDDNYNLENMLLPRNASPSTIDFRMAWQMRLMFSEKQIRDFFSPSFDYGGMSEESENRVAEQVTVDYAYQLEVEGSWEWAVFVLMHLNDVER